MTDTVRPANQGSNIASASSGTSASSAAARTRSRVRAEQLEQVAAFGVDCARERDGRRRRLVRCAGIDLEADALGAVERIRQRVRRS